MKCEKCKKKNAQIRKLKREIDFLNLCRLSDIDYVKRGRELAKEFDKKYGYFE